MSTDAAWTSFLKRKTTSAFTFSAYDIVKEAHADGYRAGRKKAAQLCRQHLDGFTSACSCGGAEAALEALAEDLEAEAE